MPCMTTEPVNDNPGIAPWLQRLFYGGLNDNEAIHEVKAP